MKTINFILDYLQDKGEYMFPREVLENALFFNTACLLGIYKIKGRRANNEGYKEIMPSFFGITFGSSGIGKNYSRDITRELFEPLFSDFINIANDSMMTKYIDEQGKLEPTYIYLSDYYIPISSTVEGIQKQAQTLWAIDRGSVNIVNDEIGNFIQKSEMIFAKLKSSWDTGLSEGNVLASDAKNYFTIKNMQYNMLLFGSPAPFDLFPQKKEALVEAYLSGMARRCFIYHNDSYVKNDNINDNFENMSKEDIDSMEQYKKEILSFVKNCEYIKYPNEIRAKLVEYDIQKQKLNSTNSILDELFSYKKIEKLLPIIATLDMSEVITEEHLEYAIDFTERCDTSAYGSIENKPMYIKIYNELEKREFTTRTDIVRSIKGVTQKSLQDEIILVEEYANILGNTLIKKEYGGIIKYQIGKMSKTDILKNIILSINPNMDYKEPRNWIAKRGDFNDLHKILSQEIRYSAGTFLNNHIKNDNYLKEQNLIIFDIDNGLTLEDAKNLLSSFTYLIATTKSHQIEKNGLTCDRFRIVLPTLSIFHLDSDTYAKMYHNLALSLGLEDYDSQCKNTSRWYYGSSNAKHWYNFGELLDIRSFIPNSVEEEIGKRQVNTYEENNEVDIDFRLERTYKWFLANTSNGNRSNMLFRFGSMIRDKLMIDNYESHIVSFNSMLSEPLTKSEVNSTIKSVGRIK